MVMALPVRGCVPFRPARRETTNVPKPLMVTDRPAASVSTISVVKARMAFSAVAFEPPEARARIATSSALVTTAGS